jgi:hypothetical protein
MRANEVRGARRAAGSDHLVGTATVGAINILDTTGRPAPARRAKEAGGFLANAVAANRRPVTD